MMCMYQSQFRLVDLAGSERQKYSKAEGRHLREVSCHVHPPPPFPSPLPPLPHHPSHLPLSTANVQTKRFKGQTLYTQIQTYKYKHTHLQIANNSAPSTHCNTLQHCNMCLLEHRAPLNACISLSLSIYI